MTSLVTLEQVLHLQQRVIEQFGGAHGLRDPAGLASAIAQATMSFDGEDLYPDLISKAAVLGFGLVSNHPFVDGNKRIGHAVMEVTLLMNGFEINADVSEQEQVMLTVAAGKMSREALTQWLRGVVIALPK